MRVAALRVFLVRDDAVPFPKSFGEHVEIVAVEMHGVGGEECVVDYEADGGVGVEVVDGPFGVWVGEIACIGEREDRVAGDSGQNLCMVCIDSGVDLLVVGPESLVIHVKEEDTASVNSASDGEIL